MAASLSLVEVDRKGRYRIGAKIGEGAMGTVYKILDTETQDDDKWAVKVTPIAKPTKNRRSQPEVCQRLLEHERAMYEVTYLHLRGSVLPNVPSAKNGKGLLVHGKSGGQNFLIMERMSESLFDAVRKLPVRQYSIDMGPIACRLLDIMKQMHAGKHVLTDVKPDNFMVAAGSGSVASRIRLLDLGLLKSYGSGAHEPNEGLSEMRGTPLYASLHTHNLQTISRRDDVEALMYLIMDLVIGAYAKHAKLTPRYFHNDSYLPWNACPSDQAIGDMKESMTKDSKSELYQRMPKSAAALLYACWGHVRSYKYKEEPNYEFLNQQFSGLSIAVPVSKKSAARKTLVREPTTGKGTPKKHSLPAKDTPIRRSPRRKTGVATAEVVNVVDSSDEDSCCSVEDMEVDEVWDGEENLKPAAVNESPHVQKARKSNYQAAKLVVQNGPHKGESYVVQEGTEEKYIVGSNPSRKGFLPLKLSGDKSVDVNHAKIELQLHKKRLYLSVWDLKSSAGTVINGNMPVRGTTNMVAMPGQTIAVGNTKLLVSRLSS